MSGFNWEGARRRGRVQQALADERELTGWVGAAPRYTTGPVGRPIKPSTAQMDYLRVLARRLDRGEPTPATRHDASKLISKWKAEAFARVPEDTRRRAAAAARPGMGSVERPATERQLSHLAKLAGRLKVPVPEVQSSREASHAIEDLKKRKKQKGRKAGKRAAM
jgi:hypothetical protein